MTPFQVFCIYLALKQHFTKPNYDVIKYNWKVRASIDSFHKRKDRYFYEKLSRKKNENEIKNFFISNFIAANNPQSIYIGDFSEEIYLNWMKRVQSLSYNFKTEISNLFNEHAFKDALECKNSQHSILIRKHLQESISIETLTILEKILHFVKEYDKILDDPMWDILSLKIKKYDSVLNIDTERFLELLKETISE